MLGNVRQFFDDALQKLQQLLTRSEGISSDDERTMTRIVEVAYKENATLTEQLLNTSAQENTVGVQKILQQVVENAPIETLLLLKRAAGVAASQGVQLLNEAGQNRLERRIQQVQQNIAGSIEQESIQAQRVAQARGQTPQPVLSQPMTPTPSPAPLSPEDHPPE